MSELINEYRGLDFQQLKNKLQERVNTVLDILENDEGEDLLMGLEQEITHINVIFKKMDEEYFKNE